MFISKTAIWAYLSEKNDGNANKASETQTA